MNIQRIKGLVWVGTLAVGATLAWSVYQFLQNKQELAAGVAKEDRLAVLNDVQEPPPPKDNLVDYKFVTQSFHAMNWTGKEPPVVVKEPDVDPNAPPPATAISTLLSVLVVQVDTTDTEGSLAFVKFLDAELAGAVKDPRDQILRIGTALTGRYSYAKVSAITVEGVEFSFDVEGRENEIVAPVAFPTDARGIVQVGPDGVLMPEVQTGIAASPSGNHYRPKETIEIGKGEYQLGIDTVATMAEDYTKILSQDIRTRIHKDPRTGKVDGLEITSVRSGSLPAGHGISDGEVLKSINGHAVTSKSDAITFVKNEADHTDTWEAVFDKRGKLITRIYHSPESE